MAFVRVSRDFCGFVMGLQGSRRMACPKRLVTTRFEGLLKVEGVAKIHKFVSTAAGPGCILGTQISKVSWEMHALDESWQHRDLK